MIRLLVRFSVRYKCVKRCRNLIGTDAPIKNTPLRMGIGIDYGEVVTGMIGSTHTVQYTAIGDPVNIASRLCDMARPGQIVLSQRAMNQVAENVEGRNTGPG